MRDLSRVRRWLLSVALCLAVAAGAPAAFASPLDLYGFGPRAIGMGGAYTGLADDYAAVYYNPAGMIFTEGSTLAVGATTAQPFLRLHLTPAPGVTAAQARALHDLENQETDIKRQDSVFFGFTSRLTDHIAIGLLASLPTYEVIQLHPIDAHLPSFIMYEDNAKQAVTYASIAITPVSGFGFAGGVSVFANCKGVFTLPITVDNSQSVTPNSKSGKPLDVNSDLTLDFPYSYSPYAGVIYRPYEWLRFGATYRGPFEWDVKVRLNADLSLDNYTINLAQLGKLLPGVFPLKAVVSISAPALGKTPIRVPVDLSGLSGLVTLNASAPVSMLADMADHWKPQEIAFGSSAEIGDAWTVSADATWQGWSQFPSPNLHFTVDNINVQLSTLPTTITARLRTLTVPILGTIGPLPPVQVSIPGISTQLNLRFPMASVAKPVTHDIVIPRLGVERRLPPIRSNTWLTDTRFSLRAGYAFEQSPYTPQRGYVNLVDPDKHIVTAGVGILFNRKVSFDIYGESHFLTPIRFAKSTVDPAEPFDAVAANGYVLSGGASLSYHW
jgi:long-subunit fatty acid transport protein